MMRDVRMGGGAYLPFSAALVHLPFGCKAVHGGAVSKGCLRCLDVAGLAAPGLERCGLQSATI